MNWPEDDTAAAWWGSRPAHLHLGLGHGACVRDHVGTVSAELGKCVAVEGEGADRTCGDVTWWQDSQRHVVLSLHHEHEPCELLSHLPVVAQPLQTYYNTTLTVTTIIWPLQSALLNNVVVCLSLHNKIAITMLLFLFVSANVVKNVIFYATCTCCVLTTSKQQCVN